VGGRTDAWTTTDNNNTDPSLPGSLLSFLLFDDEALRYFYVCTRAYDNYSPAPFFCSLGILKYIMSRESWSKQVGGVNASTDWRQAFQHTPLKGRTTDPEALDFDEASGLFLNGIKLARRGDLKAAVAQVATAYLLDGRSINYYPVLPVPEEARDIALDPKLLYDLSQNSDDSFGAMVLRIFAAGRLGSLPEDGQMYIATGMDAIDKLLKAITENPKLEERWENGGVLGGCMKRSTLLYLRSSLHMYMGNHNKAIKDLTKALEIDDKFLDAREARANLWASLKVKDYATIYPEFNQLVSEAHVDNRGNGNAYAWLAIMALGDPKLGTTAEAKQYYEKFLRATIRRDELYGRRTLEQQSPVLQLCRDQFANFTNGPPELRRARENLDAAYLLGKLEGLNVQQELVIDKSLRSHRCLNCGKMATDIGCRLSKCSRCKQVSYCSRDCQRSDWKSHKVFCGMTSSKAAAAPQPRPASKTEPTEVKPAAPKTPISEISGNARAVSRMENELRELYTEFGQGFADWWHEKTVQEREALLLDTTNNTLPRKLPYPMQVRADLEQGIMARACFDCCVEIAAGPCVCAQDQDLTKIHYYPDRLIHELYSRTITAEQAEAFDLASCKSMRTAGVFPDLFPDLAIVAPNTSEGPAKFDIDVSVFNNACPPNEKDEFKKMIADGLVQDASTVIYLTTKKLFWLQLLVKLFDTYQYTVRRVIATNPLERLRGCDHCHQTCEDQDAIRCKSCEITWWCCQGCVKATSHGRKCPIGKPSKSKLLFAW
jgi:tetratricopeptide (TPR) repeat protein